MLIRLLLALVSLFVLVCVVQLGLLYWQDTGACFGPGQTTEGYAACMTDRAPDPLRTVLRYFQ